MLVILLGRKVLGNLKKDKWSKFFDLSRPRVLLRNFTVTAESKLGLCHGEWPIGQMKNS
jgi:hypothetical protein